MASTTNLDRAKSSTKASAAQASEAKTAPEIITTIDEIKTPWSCPICEQKKLLGLITDNSIQPKRFLIDPEPKLKRKPKRDLITTSHCLHCSFGLTENEERKEMRERNDKNKSDGDQPWAAGFFFLVLMIGTILMLTVYQENPRPSLVENIGKNTEQLDIAVRQ